VLQVARVFVLFVGDGVDITLELLCQAHIPIHNVEVVNKRVYQVQIILHALLATVSTDPVDILHLLIEHPQILKGIEVSQRIQTRHIKLSLHLLAPLNLI
jgi:hypothetical protein